MTKCVCWKCKLERSFETYASLLGGDTWRIWLSMSFWNQFLGASEHIVLEFFKHLLCPSGAIHHWSVIAYPTNFVARAALGARCGQISWQAQHLEHVMIALMWPAQHFQQLRIILRGRRSTWSTLWFFVWPAQHFQQLRIISRGRRSTWSTLWSKSGTRL